MASGQPVVHGELGGRGLEMRRRRGRDELEKIICRQCKGVNTFNALSSSCCIVLARPCPRCSPLIHQ